ncbi:hypothetical protein VCHA34P126_20148 [Vibrio chagasii]|nr:hypothetical protein VCHA34P126_20148 [Vibrio chagasii]CAH7453014.1 hypothetical protein VCHA53O466_70241 [Vibrio chagasii]
MDHQSQPEEQKMNLSESLMSLLKISAPTTQLPCKYKARVRFQ